MKTAFLGLGAIGRPMATRIASAGHTLTVWNRTADRAEKFVHDIGGSVRLAPTPADAVRGAEGVITCFSTSADVYSIVEGADGLLIGLERGATVVDCTSGDPATSRKIAAAIAPGGVDFLDAPASGGVPRPEEHTSELQSHS